MAFASLLVMSEDLKAAQRIEVQGLMEFAQTDATGLARRSGVSVSTVTRFMNDKTVKHALSATTMAKLRKGAGQSNAIADLPRQLRIKAVLAVAESLGVQPGDVAASEPGALEWLDLLRPFKGKLRHDTAEMLRGMGEAIRDPGAPEQQASHPPKGSRGRRKG